MQRTVFFFQRCSEGQRRLSWLRFLVNSTDVRTSGTSSDAARHEPPLSCREESIAVGFGGGLVREQEPERRCRTWLELLLLLVLESCHKADVPGEQCHSGGSSGTGGVQASTSGVRMLCDGVKQSCRVVLRQLVPSAACGFSLAGCENTLLILCRATENPPGSRAIDPEPLLIRV